MAKTSSSVATVDGQDIIKCGHSGLPRHIKCGHSGLPRHIKCGHSGWPRHIKCGHSGWPRHHQAWPQGMAKTSSSVATMDGQDIIKCGHSGLPRHIKCGHSGLPRHIKCGHSGWPRHIKCGHSGWPRHHQAWPQWIAETHQVSHTVASLWCLACAVCSYCLSTNIKKRLQQYASASGQL